MQGAPKSDAGDRTVALDTVTVADMRRHRRGQDSEREKAGDAWVGSGFEFADEQGGPLHPADVMYAFHMIAYLAGLPPVRLHDLRHGAATLLLAAGHDMKVVQATLGLSSITIAGDTYRPCVAGALQDPVPASAVPADFASAGTAPGSPPHSDADRAQDGACSDRRQRARCSMPPTCIHHVP